MRKSNQPLSNAETANRTLRLIAAKKTDVERWARKQSLASAWDKRAEHAAQHIKDGSRVLDVGCGAMSLEKYLGPNCAYFPADVVKRREGCEVVDLNEGEFPSIHVDVITMLGVVEYLFEPVKVFRQASLHAGRLIFSYCVPTMEATAYRHGLGWVNEYALEDIQEFIRQSGWSLVQSEIDKVGPNSKQVLFVCEVA